MTSRAAQLSSKRQALQLRCALQRQHVAHMTGDIESKLATADRIIDIARGGLRNPLVVAAGVAGLWFLKPWRWVKWAGQGWLLFNLARKIRSTLG